MAFILCGAHAARAQVTSAALVALSNDCAPAADMAEAGRFIEAASHMAGVLTNPAHGEALAAPWCDAGEPWQLFWSNCRLFWLQQHDPHDPAVVNQAWQLIDRYAAAARGRPWPACHWLYDRVIDYYTRRRDGTGLRAAFERRFLHAPDNPHYLMCVLNALPAAETSAVSNHLVRYAAAGGQPFPELLLWRAQAARNSGGDAFEPAAAVVGFAPHITFHELRSALALARPALGHDPVRRVCYYRDLCHAFLACANDAPDARTAMLLAELQRLEHDPSVCADPDARGLAMRVVQSAAYAPARQQADALAHQMARLDAALNGTDDGDVAVFTNLLCLPVSPDMIYRHARALVDVCNYEQALPWFELLDSDHNPDGFTRGNACYFRAFLQANWLADPLAACTNYLRVQQFPACLVYTAGAYYEAALILERLGLPLHAEALLCVDVPTIDFDAMCAVRRLAALNLCRARGDFTNAVRHAQALCLAVPAASNTVAAWLAGDAAVQQLWPSLAAAYVPGQETAAAFHSALASTNTTPDDVLFLEALTHEWPPMSELPAAIATNRLLNNNIFSARRNPCFN